ncbi:MAG: TolC family protein [Archangiaceae bacterium]|nr:TolC family protein [Archangiaceae bacterium]
MRAALERAQAALARVDAAAAVAPPRAAFEIWDFPIGQPALAGREGIYMLGVSQELPAWGVRASRASAAAEEALATAHEARETWLTTWRELSHACVDWSETTEVVEQLGAYHGQLHSMREVAAARYAAGDSLTRLARIDAEASIAEMHVAEAHAQLDGARAALGVLLQGLAVIPTQPPALPAARAIAALDELTRLAADRSPRPARTDAMARSAEHRADASSRAASLPAVEVRATYMQLPGQRAGLGAMVAVPLPWLWGQAAAERSAARHEAAAATEVSRDERRTLAAEVARVAARASALGKSLEVLEARVLPAARRAAEAEHISFSVGGANLIEWIEAAHLAREALVDRVRQRAQLEHAWVDLLALTAAPLTTRESDPP